VSEADYIDWYEVAEAVANGRLTGHVCPKCGGGPLDASQDGINVRMRCPDCSMGFEGRLGHGRDDAMYAEADRLLDRQAARRTSSEQGSTAPTPAEEPEAEAPVGTAEPVASGPTRAEPWEWRLPAGGDEEGLSVWMPVVEAIYNGRRTGLRCPFCSETLDDCVTVAPPHFRVVCAVCSEGFEGRLNE
jgi:hypothetical protein